MLNTLPIQYASIVMFALVGCLICICASSGAEESKRLALVNQEQNHVARR